MTVFSQQDLPRHVAIIPDGNRRWAKAHGLVSWEGHEVGAKRIEEIVRAAREIGIRELSFWGSSLENLTKRPLQERQELLRIYATYFEKLLSEESLHTDQVRIRCIGRWEEQFPDRLKDILHRGIEATKKYDQYFLNFFLAYSGDDDMLQAVRRIAGEGLAPGMVTEQVIKRHLMTAELPSVDLLVRTGDDPHLSAGFMMWETKDSQLSFPQLYFPDFGAEAFRTALAEYAERERRFGQ
ncbi:MAG: polyprenyl diphosphate synthase [Candidatus Moraniibacteriota bacterium]